MTRISRLVGAVLCGVCTTAAFADFGMAFTYQGRLREGGGPANGLFVMSFALFDAESGGSQVGPTLVFDGVGGNPPPVAVAAGLFTVTLDFGVAPYEANDPRWLEIAASGTTLVPRQELTPAPFSLATRGINVDAAGNVGVGTSTPAHALDVAGDVKLRARLAVGNDASFGIGWVDFDVSHIHTDFETSVYWTPFRSYITFDPNIDLPYPSFLYSHDFECLTPATNDHDYNYLQGPYLAAFHQGGGHVGLLAGGSFAAQITGSGSVDLQVGGYIASYVGTGGAGTGTIQRNEGLEIITGNAGGPGASIVDDYSMYVFSPNHDQPMTNHYGIYLEDQDFGQNDSYAIYSAGGDTYLNGDLDVTGTLSKGAGSFKIDHPLDPENKYLYHSFVESPDMMNIYNGNVVLDDRGEATVELPDWFQGLNRDFRYQLTCIGGFAPVYVAEKVAGNRFKIAGGTPGLEVSWQVTGVRQDAFANANRVPVEVDKPDYAVGTYLHPAAFGQSKERGENHSVAERAGRVDGSPMLQALKKRNASAPGTAPVGSAAPGSVRHDQPVDSDE